MNARSGRPSRTMNHDRRMTKFSILLSREIFTKIQIKYLTRFSKTAILLEYETIFLFHVKYRRARPQKSWKVEKIPNFFVKCFTGKMCPNRFGIHIKFCGLTSIFSRIPAGLIPNIAIIKPAAHSVLQKSQSDFCHCGEGRNRADNHARSATLIVNKTRPPIAYDDRIY